MSDYGGVGKQLKVLIWDTGISFTHALRMAEDRHIVKYYTPWQTSYPKFEDFAPGLGFKSVGLEKVLEFFPYVDESDLIVCFDVGAGALLDYLRSKGKIVFGSSLKGDKLENDREFVRKLQEKIGLAVQPTEVIKGIPKLREYLKKNPDKYVKLNIFRSDMESFFAKNYEEVEGYLDHLEVALGPHNETYNFMVEDKIEGSEPGFDMFHNGKEWIKPMLWGIEQSKESYVGVYMDELPKPLMEIANALDTVLKKIDYRAPMSIECRLPKNGRPYLIDICSRYPFPLSAGYTHSIKNYSEVIWKIAQGKDVKIQTKGKYLVAMPIYSEEAKDHYVKINIPKKYREFIKLRTATQVNGQIYGVKGSKVIAVVSACGNDYHKLIKAVIKLSEQVSAFKVSDEAKASLEKIEQTIDTLGEYGLTGFEQEKKKYSFS